MIGEALERSVAPDDAAVELDPRGNGRQPQGACGARCVSIQEATRTASRKQGTIAKMLQVVSAAFEETRMITSKSRRVSSILLHVKRLG